METATFYVAYASQSPWEHLWDALVAVGTIALAIATFASVRYSLAAETRRREEDAEKIVRTNIAATNTAIFEIGSSYTSIHNFKNQFVDPSRAIEFDTCKFYRRSQNGRE